MNCSGAPSGIPPVIIVGLCILQTLVSGQALDDERWHTLRLRRRGQTVELSVDNGTKVRGKWNLLAGISSHRLVYIVVIVT